MVRGLAGDRLDSGQLAVLWTSSAKLGFAECAVCALASVIVTRFR
jgi:hypothetical protein